MGEERLNWGCRGILPGGKGGDRDAFGLEWVLWWGEKLSLLLIILMGGKKKRKRKIQRRFNKGELNQEVSGCTEVK